MDKNVGPEDRVVRIVAGIGLLVLLYFVEMNQIPQILVGVAAALLIISGLLARSLIYRMLDIDTSIQEQSYSTTDDRSGL